MKPATYARLGHDGARLALMFAGFGTLAVSLSALLAPDEDFDALVDVPLGAGVPAFALIYLRWKLGRIQARAPRAHERELLEAPSDTRRRDLRLHIPLFVLLVLLAVYSGSGLFFGYVLIMCALLSLALDRVYAKRERERGLALFRKRRSWREMYIEVPRSEAP